MIDLHCHSGHSGDAEGTIADICEHAIQKGMQTVAITDHYDFFSTCKEIDFTCDFAAIRREITTCRARYDGRIELLYGAELGQCHADPALTQRVIGDEPFDVKIGSLHSIPGGDDFYYWDFSAIEPDDFFRQYLAELLRLAQYGQFHILAHIDYPLRYLRRPGYRPSLIPYLEWLTPVFETIIRRDIALEINAKALGSWLQDVGPEAEVLAHYRRLGGRLITLGSDSHTPETVGQGLAQCAARARQAGFTEICSFVKGQVRLHPLEG